MNKINQNTRVTVTVAENGVVCQVCYGFDGEHEDKQYIYDNIKEAAKELPALFSVGEAEAPEEDEKSMEEMKSKINKGKEY